jgi:hypothetical protein
LVVLSKHRDDYLNQNTLSERGIQRVAITLELMGKYLEANDTDFIVTIAPNKNTIYPEMMRSSFSPRIMRIIWSF